MNEQDRKRMVANGEHEVASWTDAFGDRFETYSRPIDFSKAKELTPAEEAEIWGVDFSDYYDADGKPKRSQDAFKESVMKAIDEGTVDQDTAEYLADRLKDPNVLYGHLDQVGFNVSQKFVESTPDYYVFEDNFEAMRREVCRLVGVPWNTGVRELVMRGAWTLDNLQQCFENLKERDEIELAPGTYYELSDEQKGFVKVQLARHGTGWAIEWYLTFALGYENPRSLAKQISSINHFLADPANQPLLRAAVGTVWWWNTPGFEFTEARWQWMHNYVGDRLISIALLDQAYAALKRAEANSGLANSKHLVSQTTVEPVDLENLDDQQIDDLYKSAMRSIHDSRKSRGI